MKINCDSFPPIKATEEARLEARRKFLTYLERVKTNKNFDEIFDTERKRLKNDGKSDLDAILMATELVRSIARNDGLIEFWIAILKKLIRDDSLT